MLSLKSVSDAGNLYHLIPAFISDLSSSLSLIQRKKTFFKLFGAISSCDAFFLLHFNIVKVIFHVLAAVTQ